MFPELNLTKKGRSQNEDESSMVGPGRKEIRAGDGGSRPDGRLDGMPASRGTRATAARSGRAAASGTTAIVK